MSSVTWLRGFVVEFISRRSAGRNESRRKRCVARPTAAGLEALEDRRLLSSVTYAMAGSTSTLGNSTSTFNSLPTTTAAITSSGSTNPIDLSGAAFPNGFGTGDGITGWYEADLGTTAPATKMAEGAPSATTGALWDFNNGTSGSQALGTISTGSVNSRFGVIIQNTTGITLTQFTLAYTGDQWWEGTSTTNEALNFDYGTFASLPTFPTTANPSGYAADTNLTFTPPRSGTQGALNGTLAANQVSNIHDTITGLSWTNNSYLVIYWQTAATGSGDGMGISALNFSASVAITAPAVNTPTVSAITSSSAVLGGNVAADGGSAVTERGVVYAPSTDTNPHIGDGTAIKVDASGTTGAFTVPVSPLSASSSYTFEAFATNSIGTTYTAPTTFTTAAPGVITAWTFPSQAGAPDNSPVPTYGTGIATTLGMTNSYNGGNTASDDVTATPGTANTGFSENLWRIRGAQTPTGNNGWALAAPEFTQGLQVDTSTVGYSNIVFSFDWYSTTQGIRDLQVQYNTGSGWVNYQGPSPTGTFVSAGNDYYNSILSPVSPTLRIDLSGVAAANNDPDLGIRLVSAYDSTGTLGNVYASAASTAGDIIPYNNTSGNWRFGNLIFSAGVTTTTAITANPPLGQIPNQPVTFTATVTPASGSQYASGSVSFYDGTTLLGTQGVSQVGTTNVGTASVTLSTLAPGVHGDITAQYTPTPGNGLIASGSSMNLVAGDPTDNPISYTINAPQATGVDVSPVVGQSFTGVVATFSDGTYTDPTGFSASINWGDGQSSNGVIAFTRTLNQTNINGQIVSVSLFTVTGTNTYTAASSYPISVTITDPNSNAATVNPTARVAYAPLVVTGGLTVNATYGASLANQTVATFTDPGLVANLATLGISDPTTQFSATINWGDASSSAGTIQYNSSTQIFSVVGSHYYAQANSYSISVAVTPMSVSVERIDSSDPTNLNLVGDENGNTLTDSPSPDFIDQFAIGGANPASSLYTFSLPTVSTAGGNEALTNSSYSVSEGELTLSTNGEYLVTGGYNDTVSAWAPQQTFSPASVINRVIGTINGAGVINTTTDLTDAYIGDNFRGVVSTDGTQFWTSGHSGDKTSDYVHYATLGATTSTIITGPNSTYNPENINTVEIFNGQLYEGVRSAGGATAPAGIYQIGTGLPTTAGQTETPIFQLPQSNPLDITSSDKPMSPFGFYMADVSDGNPTDMVTGENVAYVADTEMGIARYDFSQTGGETSPQWNFSYYIDSTGSFKDSVFTVNSDGSVTPTASFNSANPIPTSNPNADPTKAGGVTELTGRVVNGQVQLFAVTGFGTGAQPNPGGSVIEVTDTGANAGFTKLGTNSGASELTGIAFTPTQTVTGTAQVAAATPNIVSVSPVNITYGTALANGQLSGSANYVVNGSTVSVLGTFSYTSAAGAILNASGTAYSEAVTFTPNDGTDYTTASSSASVTVGQATPNIVSVSPVSITYGTALANGQLSGSANYVVNGSTVSVLGSFSYTSSAVGTVLNASGTAYTEAVTFTPNDMTDYTTASSTVAVNVGKAATSSAVTSSANPAVYGQHITYTATVTNTSGTGAVPVGAVQFIVDGVNSGSPVSLNASGQAVSAPVIFLTGASHSVQAVYIPSPIPGPNFNASSSASLNQVVQLIAVEGTALFIVSNGATSADQVQVTPIGSSNTGSTGVQVQTRLNGVTTTTKYSQVFSSIQITLQNGNDTVQLTNTLILSAVVSAGNGNDNIQLAAGATNSVTLGDGNDQVTAGSGTTTVVAGKGNDNVQLGNSSGDSVILGNGNDNVQIGNGSNDSVILGNGNDSVQIGNGSNESVVVGNGNDSVTLGNGSLDAVTIGTGNDTVLIGAGNDNTVFEPPNVGHGTKITFGKGTNNTIK